MLIKTVMGIDSLAGHFFQITDVVFNFEPSPPHKRQLIDANTDATNKTTKTTHTTTYYHLLPHTNTTKHHQTQHPFPAQIQAHFIPSGTRLAQ